MRLARGCLVTWRSGGEMTILVIILFPLALWGLIDIYGLYRFGRGPKIDRTASILRWWQIKSMIATQPGRMVEKFPWLSKDLAEQWGVRDDDGEIS